MSALSLLHSNKQTLIAAAGGFVRCHKRTFPDALRAVPEKVTHLRSAI
jgi:hypothetical protein